MSEATPSQVAVPEESVSEVAVAGEWQSTSEPEQEERTLVYANPEQWFTGFLAPHIRRRLGGQYTWCAQWWRHAEAISRILAMWLAWEHLRHEGALGLSTWWLHHADPHLAVLLSKESGPFAPCRPDRHTPADALPYEPAPAATWMSSAFTDPAPTPETPS